MNRLEKIQALRKSTRIHLVFSVSECALAVNAGFNLEKSYDFLRQRRVMRVLNMPVVEPKNFQHVITVRGGSNPFARGSR